MPAVIRPLHRLTLRVVRFFLGDTRLFLRYITVGAASALLEYTLFNLLYSGAGLATLVANSIAIGVTLVFHFNLQKHWTFRDPQAWHRQLPRYLTMVAVAALINNVLVYLFIDVLKLPPSLAKLLEIGLLFGWTFTMSRLVVFRHSPG